MPHAHDEPNIVSSVAGDDIDLQGFLRVVFNGWRIVAAITLLCIALGVTYILLVQPVYRAETVLMPVSTSSGGGPLAQFGQISALAGLAGLDIGAGDSVEPLAILRSRAYARAFILEHDLLPVLFATKWDPAANRWRVPLEEQPDIRDAVELFDKRVRKVQEDKKTGLVTLTVQWTDPVLAANWANQLAKGVDAPMRKRVIEETTRNIEYLQRQMSGTDVVSMQQVVGRLLEGEMQKLMVAQGRTEFAFRVLDEADLPKRHASPNRALVLIFSGFVGMALSLVVVLARATIRV